MHVDRQKEQKLIGIRDSDIAPGFQMTIVAVAAMLGKLIDILRLYAEKFIGQLPTETIEDIEKNPS